MIEHAAVGLSPVRLGDRGRTARGWLVVAEGALRGIMSAGADGQEVVFAFACDRRIEPHGVMLFQDIVEAQAWVEKRLQPVQRRPPQGGPRRMSDDEVPPTPLTRADAERALLAAAMDYCWSLRDRSLPDHGPLRRLWAAYVNFRRFERPGGIA